MSVIWKYLKKRSGAIDAIRDYDSMQFIIENTSEDIKQAYAAMTSLHPSGFDGMPHSSNPTAGEARLCATLDKIDLLHDRKREARQYLDWFLPAWALLTDDERYILEAFFLTEGSREDAVTAVSERFYIERSSAHDKKNRALRKFATALYGKL